jgi:hypothetical protein
MLRWCRWDAANCRQNHSLGIIRICPQPLKWVAGLEELAVSLKPLIRNANTIQSAITHENPQLAACFTDRQDMYFLPVAKSIGRITIDLRAAHQAPDPRLRV